MLSIMVWITLKSNEANDNANTNVQKKKKKNSDKHLQQCITHYTEVSSVGYRNDSKSLSQVNRYRAGYDLN